MRELMPTLETWQAQGKAVALATLVATYGSSPRPLGAHMIISAEGEIMGSVSGGCVEGAVAQEGLGVLISGQPKLVHYGIGDELARSVGLSCGGQIQVFVQPFLPGADVGIAEPAAAVSRQFLQAVQENRPVSQVTALTGSEIGGRYLAVPDCGESGTIRDPVLAAAAQEAARQALACRHPLRISVPTPTGEVDLFADVQLPAPQLIIVGAVHIAIPLITFARELGFYTVVVDARSAFATAERFGHAHQLIRRWPADALAEMTLDESTCVVLLSHDEKLDDPALAHILKFPVPYVGALGSRRTHARRVDALRELGVSPEEIRRIHAPIGLDLGGRRPEEIALAIMAEIVAVVNRAAPQGRRPEGPEVNREDRPETTAGGGERHGSGYDQI